MSEMTHKENFLTWIAVHSVSLLSIVVFFKVVYSNTNSINGWTQYQTLMVLGTATLMTGLGEFDFKLAKPLNILFQSAFRWVDTEDLAVTPTGLLLIWYSLANLKPENLPLNIIGFLLMVTSSMVILFSLLTIIQSLAFRHVQINSVTDFYWSIINITKYPAKAIKNVSQATLYSLVPIGIISSVPSEVLFGRWEPVWITGSLFSAFVLFIFSRWIFMSSLRHYSSASS